MSARSRSRYGDTPVLEVEGDISLSEDPAISFSFVPEGPAAMAVQVEDSNGRKFEQSWPSRPDLLARRSAYVAERADRRAGRPVRCSWCGNDPLYRAYHDEEWGRPDRATTATCSRRCASRASSPA